MVITTHSIQTFGDTVSYSGKMYICLIPWKKAFYRGVTSLFYVNDWLRVIIPPQCNKLLLMLGNKDLDNMDLRDLLYQCFLNFPGNLFNYGLNVCCVMEKWVICAI